MRFVLISLYAALPRCDVSRLAVEQRVLAAERRAQARERAMTPLRAPLWHQTAAAHSVPAPPQSEQEVLRVTPPHRYLKHARSRAEAARHRESAPDSDEIDNIQWKPSGAQAPPSELEQRRAAALQRLHSREVYSPPHLASRFACEEPI